MKTSGKNSQLPGTRHLGNPAYCDPVQCILVQRPNTQTDSTKQHGLVWRWQHSHKTGQKFLK